MHLTGRADKRKTDQTKLLLNEEHSVQYVRVLDPVSFQKHHGVFYDSKLNEQNFHPMKFNALTTFLAMLNPSYQDN